MTWPNFPAMTTPPSTSIAMPPATLCPKAHWLSIASLCSPIIMRLRMGHIFFLCPLVGRGSRTLRLRGLCHSRGAVLFFFNALDVHRGSGIPKASPTSVTHPRLLAFFAIELTQGPHLRVPNLHVTQSIKRPQLGAPSVRVAKTVPCEGAVRCRGKVVAKCYGCSRAALRAAHKDGLCVPCQEGEEPEGGGEEELVEDPNGVNIEQCAQCLHPVGSTTGHFLLSG